MNREQDESMKDKYLKALEASTNRLENTINGLMGIVALQSNQQAAGSGIGLHLIRSMIEKNGGSIKVESWPGQDTIFYCELIEY